MDFGTYIESAVGWLVTSGVQIVLILLLMVVGLYLNKIFTARLYKMFEKGKDEEFRKRADTLTSVIRVTLSIAIVTVSLLIIIGEIGIEIGPILAAAGILGLAVGFGAQNLVQDVISGFFLLLEDQIRVGDVVEVAGKSGLVEKINLRMCILRDLAGNVHFVRNGKIDIVTNMTKDYSRYVFEIGVAYRENVDEVIEVIREVDEELRSDSQFCGSILEPIEILGLDKFADSAVVIKARTKTKPSQQWAVGREFNHRLKKRFDERNIEIPFPHVTLYMGEDKQGGAPPMNVALRNVQEEA
ncbi:MAG: mechanosensitive ion channel family protein [Desulfovibrionales bacterium]